MLFGWTATSFLFNWSLRLASPLKYVVDDAQHCNAYASAKPRPVHNVQSLERVDESLFEETDHFSIELYTL